MVQDRYYVQRITGQIFVIRECLSTAGEPGLDDRFVRAFDIRYDADLYARDGNERQKKLDEQYGYWTQHAL